jgi:hypothetical protein
MESKGKNFKRDVLPCKRKGSPIRQKNLQKAARNLGEVRSYGQGRFGKFPEGA